MMLEGYIVTLPKEKSEQYSYQLLHLQTTTMTRMTRHFQNGKAAISV